MIRLLISILILSAFATSSTVYAIGKSRHSLAHKPVKMTTENPNTDGDPNLKIVAAIASLQKIETSKKLVKSREMKRIYQISRNQDKRKFASFYLGLELLQKDPKVASNYFKATERLASPEDPIVQLAKFYNAKSFLNRKKYMAGIKILQGLLDGNELGSAWKKTALELVLNAHFQESNMAEFARKYPFYEKSVAKSQRDQALVKKAALVYKRTLNTEKFVEIIEELAARYPTNEQSRWAFKKLMKLNCSEKISKSSKLSVADQSISTYQYYYSYGLLKKWGRNKTLDIGLKEFLLSSADEKLRIKKGGVRRLTAVEKIQFLFDTRNYSEAYIAGKKLFNEKSSEDSEVLKRTIFLLGRTSLRLKNYDRALEHFTRFLFRFPKDGRGLIAKEYIADSLRYAQNFSASTKNYRDLVKKKPLSNLRWYHFWSAFRANNIRESGRLLHKKDYISPRDQIAPGSKEYWTARYYDRLGETSKARIFYQKLLENSSDGFYGNLILARYPGFKTDNKGIEETGFFGNYGYSSKKNPFAKIQGTRIDSIPGSRISLIQDLSEAYLFEQAQLELRSMNRYRGQDPLESIRRSNLARKINHYQLRGQRMSRPFTSFLKKPKSWQEALDHQKENSGEWKAYYPKPYEEIVNTLSSKIAIDPYLVWSIMRQESRYSKTAVSPVGARGLLQLMPYTAIRIAKLIGDQNFEIKDLHKPEYNIGYGAWYLKRLLTYYSDNTILAVAAYNAGPKAVNAWIDRCDSCDIDEFIESISYTETRKYVKKILRSYSRYHRIYERNSVFYALPQLPDEVPSEKNAF